MSEDCEVCRVICTVGTGDPFDDECHNILDQYAQADDADIEDLCDVLEQEVGVDCNNLPFEIPSD